MHDVTTNCDYGRVGNVNTLNLEDFLVVRGELEADSTANYHCYALL